MTKDFIPYAESLALKGLGFDEDCYSYFREDMSQGPIGLYYSYDQPQDLHVLQPTFSQAFRFFRDKHLLFPSFTRAKRFYETATEKVYDVSIQNENEDELVFVGCFDSYEEGEIACLNKLIEIVKETK